MAFLDEIVYPEIDEFDQKHANALDCTGAFTVNGEYYSVLVHREFTDAQTLQEFAKKIEASPHVVVRYNPRDPSENEVEID
jgi:hypothetical protein